MGLLDCSIVVSLFPYYNKVIYLSYVPQCLIISTREFQAEIYLSFTMTTLIVVPNHQWKFNYYQVNWSPRTGRLGRWTTRFIRWTWRPSQWTRSMIRGTSFWRITKVYQNYFVYALQKTLQILEVQTVICFGTLFCIVPNTTNHKQPQYINIRT